MIVILGVFSVLRFVMCRELIGFCMCMLASVLLRNSNLLSARRKFISISLMRNPEAKGPITGEIVKQMVEGNITSGDTVNVNIGGITSDKVNVLDQLNRLG
ncbi:unnamed protein product [Ixodes pacificus]